MTTTHESVNSRNLTVDMHVRLFHEGRLRWGHPDQEYRRTVVIVSSIETDHICFCIAGVRVAIQTRVCCSYQTH